MSDSQRVAPWVRITIMLVATAGILFLSLHFTGGLLPQDPRQALMFQNALLLIVLGSALLEHHYTKPADAVVNSLMGLITLLTVYSQAPRLPWLIVSAYCLLVFSLSLACVAVSSGSELSEWRDWVARHTYRPSVTLGKSRVLFTVVFIAGLWFFYSIQEPITLALIIFWGIFIAIWPLKVPELLSSWTDPGGPSSKSFGEISRIDSPNILRVALNGETKWSPDQPYISVLPSGDSNWVQPLYSQFQDGRLLATGLVTDIKAPVPKNLKNCVFCPEEDIPKPNRDEITQALGGGPNAILVGFVVERSSIGAIKFETLKQESCHHGMLVWCNVNGDRVYYQIIEGETQEESFASDKHGFQVATATQLGTLVEKTGFKKYDWLPGMNTPVFTSYPGCEVKAEAVADGDFVLGDIPKSCIKVGGDFISHYNVHTALLGVTGSGKTELAFDMIRHALRNGIRVVCIDLTAQYEGRLSDLLPVDLSVEEDTAKDLSKKLFDVETGTYGAPGEKKALNQFATSLREEITASIKKFILKDNSSHLGLIRLEEISNTKATLWITELYMTCLLKCARENLGACPPILIVVEEAHTVMPEANTMGLGDFDSKGLVGKIAQIALQGRKYGVGLLVLAQRTATVSKSVLTQCNTIISFTCYDDTSLGFLRNIFGPEHVALIPNLPPLHAVAFGPWVRSEKPIVFQVPYDEKKTGTPASKKT
ncbi:helicase HerA domain-containing protein [Desulfatitalea tepidiphila]|uniref:helicase HerA domain-containing protein n=1 Tax=Desulfatitalea tepidiphila TaxID=1185843 RepID=UPI0006B5E5C4|nr:DUF87 domain-containing protein [Desulfatitalea tepidiphila]